MPSAPTPAPRLRNPLALLVLTTALATTAQGQEPSETGTGGGEATPVPGIQETPAPVEQSQPPQGQTPEDQAPEGEATQDEPTGPLAKLLAKTRTTPDQATEGPLADHIKDLRLDYKGSAEYLEEKFEVLAGLGDEVVPGLLELLSPEQPVGGAERNLADNAARVLRRMDLEAHADTLIDLFESGSGLTRREVLPLLGRAGGPRVEALLIRTFPQLDDAGLIGEAFDADRRLGCRALAAQARESLQHPDQRVRGAAVRHVYDAAMPIALPALREALRNERQTNILGQHVRGLAELTSRDAETTSILLGIVQDSRVALTAEDRRLLLRELGTIAPLEHPETAEFLEQQIEGAPQFEDALAAGLGLRDLGEKRADRKVYDRAETEWREDPSGSTLEQFGDAYRAFEDYRKADQAYRRAIERDGRNPLFRRRLQRKLAGVYAASDNLSKFVKAVESAEMSRDDLDAMAAEDPAVAAMLEKERAQKLIDDLFRDG